MTAFRMVRVGLVGSILAGALAGLATSGSGASADTLSLLTTTTTSTTSTTTPLFVNWADVLPTLTDAYDPTSTNDCVAGRSNCVDITIREMERRFDPLGQACNDNAVFSLAYLRTTQTYEWARNQAGFFNDTPWVNHEDAVFAKYYFSAYDNWASGNMAAVPQAWQIAFNAAANDQVNGAGNLMLGMSAHVNRDLPYVLAAIGITYPDGTTRKPDHDKVNEFLNDEVNQLLEELSARLDPSVWPNIQTPYGVGVTALFQTLEAWREQAWRNAEALTDAPTPADRAVVAQQIEDTAAAEAEALVASDAYAPPATTSASRDSFCAANNGAAAPDAYPWGEPTPW
jgi:uncharacterized protein DUF5995